MRMTIIFVIGFFSLNFLYAQEVDLDALQGLGETRYHLHKSELLDQTYHIFVRLPEEIGDGRSYPAVYLLDGGATYPILAGYYRYLRLAEEIPTAIIVGISYGTDDWQKGNMRSRDFTAPASDRDYWGGAEKFRQVLREEIFPLVEKHYPADPKQRVIFGQSLGGQFVLHCAMREPNLFAGYIASNPALHRNLDFFINRQNIDVAGEGALKPGLFVSSGSEDNPRFRQPALAWMRYWENQSNLPWHLRAVTLEGHSHFSPVPLALRQGLRWILGSN